MRGREKKEAIAGLQAPGSTLTLCGGRGRPLDDDMRSTAGHGLAWGGLWAAWCRAASDPRERAASACRAL
jgi:hypothetical protein